MARLPSPSVDYDPGLIFDIGLHIGDDTLYYLKKGFRVVGVEAREDLCEIARHKTVDFQAPDMVEIINKALFSKSGELVSFYINERKDDWGSLFRGAAEADGSTAREIQVATTTLHELLARYGTPYYIKCDIEGGDALFVEQLANSSSRPAYVSVEASSPEYLAILRSCGYTSFQLVNQYLNPYASQPDPVREGVYAETYFTHAMSGPFGRDLPSDRWIDFRPAMQRLLDWHNLRDRDASLVVGWLDVHARLAEAERHS